MKILILLLISFNVHAIKPKPVKVQAWKTGILNKKINHYISLGVSDLGAPINDSREGRDHLGLGTSLQYKYSYDATLTHYELGFETAWFDNNNVKGNYISLHADASFRFLLRDHVSWSVGGALALGQNHFSGTYQDKSLRAYYGGITNFVLRRNKDLSYVITLRLLQEATNDLFIANFSFGVRF